VKILVTGAAGQLGAELMRVGETRNLAMIGTTRAELDVTDAGAVDDVVRRIAPKVVINAAAWTAVDDCEGDPARANMANGTAVEHVVAAAESVGAHIIQISTDYVFSGTIAPGRAAAEWSEGDEPDPQSAYGRSKLLGEQAAANHTVVRTSWVCGELGSNMVKTILRVAENTPELHFVCDQRGKPSFTGDLSERLLDLSVSPGGVPTGILHLTNSRSVSWFEFAREVMAAAGHDPERVHPILTADMTPPRPAPRPANSSLADTRMAAAGFAPMRDFSEPLHELVAVLTRH